MIRDRELYGRSALFSTFMTVLWVLITVYFTWRIGQALTGQVPQWVAVVAGLGLVYIWYLRLAAVKAITVSAGGRVTFFRGLGRREVHVLDVESMAPLFLISRTSYVLRHARGVELLLEDPDLIAAAVRELRELNPRLKVRGVAARAIQPQPPKSAKAENS